MRGAQCCLSQILANPKKICLFFYILTENNFEASVDPFSMGTAGVFVFLKMPVLLQALSRPNGTIHDAASKALAVSKSVHGKAKLLKDAALTFDPRLSKTKDDLNAVDTMGNENEESLARLRADLNMLPKGETELIL